MNNLRARVIDVLRTVFDPEIPVNIFDLGLVYGIDVDEERHHVHVLLTLTANEMIRAKRELAEMTVGTGETWIGQLPTAELKALFKLG